VAGAYIANGCLEWDAVIGRFRFDDLLADRRAAGEALAQLDIGLTVDPRASHDPKAALEHDGV
jgi:hypothetical protein